MLLCGGPSDGTLACNMFFFFFFFTLMYYAIICLVNLDQPRREVLQVNVFSEASQKTRASIKGLCTWYRYSPIRQVAPSSHTSHLAGALMDEDFGPPGQTGISKWLGNAGKAHTILNGGWRFELELFLISYPI